MDKEELAKCKQAIRELTDAEQYEDAMPIIYAVLDEHPNEAVVIHTLGYIYLQSGKYAFAYQMFRRALQEQPGNAAVWTSVGRAAHEMAMNQEAINCFLKAVELNPEYTLAYSNASATLVQLSDWDGAEKAAKMALETDPTDRNSLMNLAHCHLARREWVQGWAAWALSIGGKYRKEWTYGDEPRWDGSAGKRLVVYGEQGLGDEISYASCLPDAIASSEKVYVDCDAKLEGLFRRSFPLATVHGTRLDDGPKWVAGAEINARCCIGGLPEFFRKSDADFPGTPYLVADPERRIMWRALFDSWGGKVVGIATNGGGKMTNATGRKIPFESWVRLLKREGYHFVSLDYKQEDTQFLEELHGVKIHKFPWAANSKDYDDTAALVAELDLVIGVNTAVLHLAGGLGVKTIALVSKYHQWRFTGPDYPWCKSWRLEHQGDREWKDVMRQLKWS